MDIGKSEAVKVKNVSIAHTNSSKVSIMNNYDRKVVVSPKITFGRLISVKFEIEKAREHWCSGHNELILYSKFPKP
jgi:hypothetical protein